MVKNYLKRIAFVLAFALMMILMMPVKVFANEKLPSPTGVKWGLTCPGSVYACWDDLDNDNVDEILIKEYKDGVCKTECIVSAQELNYPSVSFPQLSAEETDTFSVTFRDSTGMYEDSDEIFSDILDTSWLSQKMPNPTNLSWENNSGSYFSIWEYPYEGNGSKFVINLYEDGVLFETFEADGWNLSTGYWFWLRGDFENHEYTYGVKAVDEFGSFEDSDEVISEPADISVIKELWGDYREISIYYDANGGTKGDYWVEKDNTMPCALGTENSLSLVLLEESSYVGVDRVLPPEGKKFAGFEIGGTFYPVGEPIELLFGDDIVWKYIWVDDDTETLPNFTRLDWFVEASNRTHKHISPLFYIDLDSPEYSFLCSIKDHIAITINTYEDDVLICSSSYSGSDIVYSNGDLVFCIDYVCDVILDRDYEQHNYKFGIVVTDLTGEYKDSSEVFSGLLDKSLLDYDYGFDKMPNPTNVEWSRYDFDGEGSIAISSYWTYEYGGFSYLVNLYEDGELFYSRTSNDSSYGSSGDIYQIWIRKDYIDHEYTFGVVAMDPLGEFADSDEVKSGVINTDWVTEAYGEYKEFYFVYDANGGIKGGGWYDTLGPYPLTSGTSIGSTTINYNLWCQKSRITAPEGKRFLGIEINGVLYKEGETPPTIYPTGDVIYKYIWEDDPNWVEPTLDGLVDVNGILKYYKKGVLQDSYTGLLQSDSVWYYVQKGVVEKGVNTLVNYGGTWYYVKDSVVDFGFTGIFGYGGTDYYIQKGVLKWGVEGLTNVNGTWYYLNNSAVNKGYTGLVLYNGTWFYVQKGQLIWNVRTLVQHGGTWYYVNNSKVDWNYTGLCTYGGTDYYIQKGVLKWGVNGLTNVAGTWYNLSNSAVNKGYTGLVQYNGSWFYVKSGVLDWNYTGITNYGGTSYYVQKGTLKWGVNGLTNVGGTWYNLSNSAVNKGYTGLVLYNGTWFYVQKGQLIWGVRTLVQYNGTWYYVNNSKIDWNYTGICTYGGTDYYIQKGVLKWGVNGLTNVGGTWYNLSNSAVNKGYTGLVLYNGTWFYVQKGQLIWGVRTLVQYNGTWYYVNNSKIDWSYTGLVPYNGSLFYVQKGVLKWGYNGTVQYNGKKYNVVNSTAK